jgi:putative transposase
MLVTPSDADGISRMMQYLGRYYVAYINRNRDSSGTLWEGRYRGSLVQDAYLLSCMRYIELTPVRLGILPELSMQRWTSHYANAYGRPDPLLVPHAMYQKLGASEQARQKAYLDFCNAHIDKAFSHWICTSWRSGRPLGSQTFIQMIEETLHCKVGNAKPGRPRKIELESANASNYGGFLNYAFKEAER